MIFLTYADRETAEERSSGWAEFFGCGEAAEDVTRFWFHVRERSGDAEADADLPVSAVVVIEVPASDDHHTARVPELVRADRLSVAEVAALVDVHPAWAAGVAYAVDDLVRFARALYRVVQAHTSQVDWAPPVVPALFVEVSPPGVVGEWAQPAGAHDAYPLGARVTYRGTLWESTVAANVWEPGVVVGVWIVYGAAPPPPAVSPWVQPTGAHDAYNIGDRVTHNGQTWESTANANVWAPGVFGWVTV